jgi:hypothetical protein
LASSPTGVAQRQEVAALNHSTGLSRRRRLGSRGGNLGHPKPALPTRRAEWLVAVTFTPKWADQFLGQQGDIFDAQKDMALATAGAILSVGIVSALNRRESWPSLSETRIPDGSRRA